MSRPSMSPQLASRICTAEEEDVKYEAKITRRMLRRSTVEESKLRDENSRATATNSVPNIRGKIESRRHTVHSMPDLQNKIENYLKRQSIK